MRGRIGFHASALPGDPRTLHPLERSVTASASPVRQAEFAAGRACARAALHAVGIDTDSLALMPDARGAVRWPSGTVGSITHTIGWTGAVAARRSGWGGVSSLGIDAEVAHPLQEEVLDVVASFPERSAIRALALRDGSVPWSVVLFAAKEAAFKAWYPLTGDRLVHDQVRVSFSGRRFVALRVERDRPERPVVGRWSLAPGVVVAVGVIRSRTTAVPLSS